MHSRKRMCTCIHLHPANSHKHRHMYIHARTGARVHVADSRQTRARKAEQASDGPEYADSGTDVYAMHPRGLFVWRRRDSSNTLYTGDASMRATGSASRSPWHPRRGSAERAAGVARIARAVSRSPVSPGLDEVRLGRMWVQFSMPMDASRNDKDYHIDDASVRSMRMRRKVEEELG